MNKFISIRGLALLKTHLEFIGLMMEYLNQKCRIFTLLLMKIILR